MIVQADTEHAQDISLAKEIAETLNAHYPGHLWAVTVRGGAVVIKDLYISSLYGVVLHTSNMQDAGVRSRKVIGAGGELLERANLRRGEYTEKATKVEGINNYNPVRR